MRGGVSRRSSLHPGLGLGLVVVLLASTPQPASAAIPDNVPRSEPASPEALEAAVQRLEGLQEHGSIHALERNCGTADLLDVELGWEQLSDSQRRRAAEATAPERPLVAARGGDSEERGGVGCFHTLENVVESDHFSVQWGSGSTVSTTTAEELLAALEETRLTYLDAGYAEPLGNPDYKVPFYLGNSGPSAPSINFSGGYATVCSSYEHAYVVLSSINSEPGGQDVANHELFHAVQMGSPVPYEVDSYYWESSAVWAEKLAQPTWAIYSWFLPYYTNHTEWALALTNEISSNDGFLHRYAMFILPIYIEEWAPSGFDALLEVWNGSGGGVQDRLNGAWEEFGDDTDFRHQFGHFTSYVSTMDFEHRNVYIQYEVPAREVFEPEPSEEHEESNAPDLFGSHYYKVLSTGAMGSDTKLRVRFEGDPDWVIAMNRSEDGATAFSKVVVSGDEGTARLDGIDVGTLYNDVWVIVTNASGSDGEYRLELSFVEQTEAEGSDRPEYDDPGDPGAGGGCQGCVPLRDSKHPHPFSYSAGQGLAASILPLLLLFRRIR